MMSTTGDYQPTSWWLRPRSSSPLPHPYTRCECPRMSTTGSPVSENSRSRKVG